jgi:hypothetical protein
MAGFILWQDATDETRIREEMLRRLIPVIKRDTVGLAAKAAEIEQLDDALEILADYDIRRKAAPGIDLDVDE